MGKIERTRLAPGDRERLEKLVSGRNKPQKVVWRARIVLLSGAGVGAVAAARQSVPTVRRYRRRYVAAEGVAERGWSRLLARVSLTFFLTRA